MTYCSGECKRKYGTHVKGNNPIYINGVKWCKHCRFVTKWEGVRCPCCRYMLRNVPRTGKKAHYQRERIGIEDVVSP